MPSTLTTALLQLHTDLRLTLTLTLTLLLLAFLSGWCLTATIAQSEGDLKLVGGGNSNEESLSLGRVEIFFKKRWSTICDRNYGGGANTICHQLNYTHYSQHHQGTSTKLMNKSLKECNETLIENLNATDDVPIALRDLDCGPIYSSPLVMIHTLRCDYTLVDSDESTECTHDDDLAVACNAGNRSSSPYESEVRLVGGQYSSSGTLEVYLNGGWGNVCRRGFDQNAADTACRQLGYTHAERFSETDTGTTGVVWFSELACDTPQPCINHCFNKNDFNETSCPERDYVTVQCAFNMDLDANTTFGNAVMCSLQRRYSKTPAYFVAIMSFSSILWIVLTSAVVVMAICCSVRRCPCYKLRKRDYSYATVDPDNAN